MTEETKAQWANPITEAALAAANRRHDNRKLYTTVVNDLLKRLCALPTDTLESACRDEPPSADKPWDPAIAAAVEYSCQAARIPRPGWCNEPSYNIYGAAIRGHDTTEWARTLHDAPAAYIRHGVFPKPGFVSDATGREPTVIQGYGAGLPSAAHAMRSAATHAEEWLRREGLRGHVYLTGNEPVWFATNAHGHPKVIGPQPVAEAFRKNLPEGQKLLTWARALHKLLDPDDMRHAPTWWDTTNLVVTGTSPELGLAVIAGFADEVEPKHFDRMTWTSQGKSVDGIDILVRTVTGRPLNARMRSIIASAIGQELSAGRTGWIKRWIDAAEKTLAEGKDLRTVLRRGRRPDVNWPCGPHTTCGELEADLTPSHAPESEHGRLWIRRNDDGDARLVLLERTDSEIDLEIEEGRQVATALLEADARRQATPANATGAWSVTTRPGWKNIVGFAIYMATQAYSEDERLQLEEPGIIDGRLRFQVPEDARPHLRGMIAVSEALSAETCELCGGKGDPVANADGRPAGSRCTACRPPDARVLERNWPKASPAETTTRVDEDHAGLYRRLEDELTTRLMRGDEDEGRAAWQAQAEGWCGLVRAMFLTLGSEQEPRPHDPMHVPFRLGVMKSKWGRLRVESAQANDYQQGVIDTIELMSGWTCERCGHPATERVADYVRPECDECWKTASPKDHRTAAESTKIGRTDCNTPDWYRGVRMFIAPQRSVPHPFP